VKDIDAEALSPKGLAKIKKANINRLKARAGKPRLGPASPARATSSRSASTISDHAKETGSEIPKEPIIFDKRRPASRGRTTMSSSRRLAQARLGSRTLHRDRQPRALSRQEKAMSVGGRLLRLQRRVRTALPARARRAMGQGQGLETFGPIGPWMVTKDEIKDVQKLDMWLDVNGKRMQNGSTRTMIFASRISSGIARNSSSWSRAISSPPARRPASGSA
jgi:2-keto-4-pentenoate hydratase/2-oxohepta-3-ene-1,7-dioic acid hydratase in catechol pathway